MTILSLFLLMVTAVMVTSCEDKDDVNNIDDYYFYLDIQSDVRLSLNDAADEDESGTDSPLVDDLSRTIYRMQKAIRERDYHNGNRNKVASLLSVCDSLYRCYAEVNPENKGKPVCNVKLLRCPLYPNGTANFKDAITLKHYVFWREDIGNFAAL